MRAIAVALAGPAALVAAQAPAERAVVPLDLSGPRPIAMLSVGSGPPVRVIFDTGASGNVIDPDFARSAGLPDEGPAQVHTPAGGPPMQGFRTVIADGRLGDAPLRGIRAVAIPSPALRHLEVQGVFGPGTFSGRLVHLDLARGEVRVTEKTAATIPAGPSFPYSGDGHMPRLPGVPVDVAGQAFHGHIDTGQPGLLMMPLDMARQVPLDGELRQAPRPARLADGVPRPLFEGRIRGTVQIGPLTLENPEVRFMAGLRRINVGMQALRGLTVVLDPAERRSWLVRPSA